MAQVGSWGKWASRHAGLDPASMNTGANGYPTAFMFMDSGFRRNDGIRKCGAVEKTRTSTAFRPQRPQRCASTSSATTARDCPRIGPGPVGAGPLAKGKERGNGVLAPIKSSPAFAGEGDHAKHGGGALQAA